MMLNGILTLVSIVSVVAIGVVLLIQAQEAARKGSLMQFLVALTVVFLGFYVWVIKMGLETQDYFSKYKFHEFSEQNFTLEYHIFFGEDIRYARDGEKESVRVHQFDGGYWSIDIDCDGGEPIHVSYYVDYERFEIRKYEDGWGTEYSGAKHEFAYYSKLFEMTQRFLSHARQLAHQESTNPRIHYPDFLIGPGLLLFFVGTFYACCYVVIKWATKSAQKTS